jgi:CRISPR-associated protein Csb1
MSTPNQYDKYLEADGPSALVIRQHLVPVEGRDGVLFPSTFAAGDGFTGGYNVDSSPDGTNVCLVDSVGSQANRIEPIFKEDKYKDLVPQITVKAGEKVVSILEAGHRAGDAIVRCSELQKDLQDAFKALLSGNAEPLAKLAPTSLVFGVWDSRDTQAKVPRVVSSAIRAFNVRKLTRSAQYVPAVRYIETGLLEEPADKATKDGYSVRGFLDVPATGSHGGVIADGGIRREATLALAALRLLSVAGNKDKTLALRRYILGLALVAFTYPPAGYLRQGCLLVLDDEPKEPHQFVEVSPDGKREKCRITHEEALTFATAAAKAFGVGTHREVAFDPDRAKKDLAGDGKGKKGKKDKDPAPAK